MGAANAKVINLQQTTLSARIVDQIERMITSGELKPGDRLDEIQLGEKFGVSRTPVREAIQKLGSVGLVELKPRKGAVVTRPSIPQLIGMFEVMRELDILCARYAARRANSADKAALTEIQADAKHHSDPDSYWEVNRNFHCSIYKATHNQYLEETAVRTWILIAPYRRFRVMQHGRIPISIEEHGAIVNAICIGDSDLAANAMQSHVTFDNQAFFDFIFRLVQ